MILQNENVTGRFDLFNSTNSKPGECMVGSSKVIIDSGIINYTVEIEMMGRALSVQQGYIGGASLAVES